MSNPKKHRRRWPKLPIQIGKAHQRLSTAIICGDHELASWMDCVVLAGQVDGSPQQVAELRQRLDRVMEPHGRPSTL
jgi:hypothetical protein